MTKHSRCFEDIFRIRSSLNLMDSDRRGSHILFEKYSTVTENGCFPGGIPIPEPKLRNAKYFEISILGKGPKSRRQSTWIREDY